MKRSLAMEPDFVELIPPETELEEGKLYISMIYGTTVQAGSPDVPVRRRVQLFECANAHGMAFPTSVIPVRWQWSAPDGSYRFEGLDPAKTYGVIAYDHTGVHDPVVKLNLVPEVE